MSIGIEASLELGEWANEEIYEVKGTATSSMLFDSGGPRRSRENKALLVCTYTNHLNF